MQANSLSLIVANIEKDRHRELFVPFCLSRDPEVILMQEVNLRTFQSLAEALGAKKQFFIPMGLIEVEEGGPLETIGLGALLREKECSLDVAVYREFCYRRAPLAPGKRLPLFNKAKNYASDSYIQHFEVRKGDAVFALGNTHFPWTPDGNPDNEQYTYMPQVVEYAKINKLIVCGDLNAPRLMSNGTKGQIWNMLAKHFHDNIPDEMTSTLDPSLHRASKNGAPLPLVVDALFTPQEYRAENVTLHCGVSDHKAISAVIRRVV